ncbi:XylR N-terminal domain-containing protein [Sporosarcina newyorkensis]|uniref:XylR N-terminal domain-containing protein n=1 Tax=Sporosarcina newyorkensis TaxID=759851 RepID=UPI003D087C53
MVMKANHLLLQNVLDVNPRTGVIQLHDKRMMLMSVEALGILRSDLITTLGYERAKGFLMRYGWSCGYKAAETLESQYEWKSLKELIFAGPAMHTLEGVVTVEPDYLEICENHLEFGGYWRNSYEADEHIEKHGIEQGASCWTLVGYASGYLTKIFGKQIIAHEKYCRANGDAYCYFVAQTVEKCDEKHLQDLRYYQTESLQGVLEDVYVEMQQLNEDIMESEKIQNELTELFLEDKDLNEITQVIGKKLECSIVVEHASEIYSSYYETGEDEKRITKWFEDEQMEMDRVVEVFNVKSNKKNLGRMIVLDKQKLSHKKQLIINRALMVLTIQMFHYRKLMESKWKQKATFFDDIIQNKLLDPSTVQRQAAMFGFTKNQVKRVIAMKVEPFEKTEEVLSYLIQKHVGQDPFLKDGRVIMIVSLNEQNCVERYATRLIQELHKSFPRVKVHLGSGRAIKSIDLMRDSYLDATRICDFIYLTHPMESKQADYKELEPIMILLQGADQKEMIRYYTETLGEIIDYDSEGQGNLLFTLKAFLDNNGNLQQTADQLHLSIAGLRYRIERIEALSGIDLKTGAGRFKGQLATQIYYALQIISKHNGSFN